MAPNRAFFSEHDWIGADLFSEEPRLRWFDPLPLQRHVTNGVGSASQRAPPWAKTERPDEVNVLTAEITQLQNSAWDRVETQLN